MKAATVLYPMFLSLHRRRCAVVGVGSVGCRKLSGLLAANASEILVLDRLPLRELSAQAQTLLGDKRVSFECRSFNFEDALACDIVFASTPDRKENLRIARLCEKSRAFCNCVTEPEAGDFIVPAVARKDSLAVALSTSGNSPALARKWRSDLEAWLEPRARAAQFMGRLRDPILALGLDHNENKAIFRKLSTSPIPGWLENNEISKCRIWLNEELPESLASAIDSALEEYENAFC